MIPRIKTGDSFKGAALYYLHDKRLEGEDERLTGERVAWTYALNTLENDPEAVIREMQHTAMSQQRLKYLSGNRTDGRPTERTVMTVSLAWSPEQSPDRENMIEAGQSFLKHMGWQEHQVLFVAHNDTAHPHVHLIINRIHPETGMTMDSNWFKTRAQKWAYAYEQEHGRIYCQAREEKYGREQARNAAHMSYREWLAWQELSKDGDAAPGGRWETLKANQREDRIEFWKDTGRLRNQLRAALRDEVRAEFAPQWKAYAQEKGERDKKSVLYDREARRAIRELRKQGGTRQSVVQTIKGPDGRTYHKRRGVESEGIELIKERKRAYHARQREELWEMRAAIGTRQKERLEALMAIALGKLGKDRTEEYNAMLARQRTEKSALANTGGGQLHAAGEANPSPLPLLSPTQLAAYVAEARASFAREPNLDQAHSEASGSAWARSHELARQPSSQDYERLKDAKGKKEPQAEGRQTSRDRHPDPSERDPSPGHGDGRDR